VVAGWLAAHSAVRGASASGSIRKADRSTAETGKQCKCPIFFTLAIPSVRITGTFENRWMGRERDDSQTRRGRAVLSGRSAESQKRTGHADAGEVHSGGAARSRPDGPAARLHVLRPRGGGDLHGRAARQAGRHPLPEPHGTRRGAG